MKKGVALTKGFIIGLLLISGFIFIRPMDYPPAVSYVPVNTYTIC